MPSPGRSKKTGSTQWMMVRISGAILLFLLLGHFWVHHFFIKDFYGQVNVIDRQPNETSIIEYIPMDLGQKKLHHISAVNDNLEGTDYYLHEDQIKSAQDVTILKDQNSTELFLGHIDRDTISSLTDDELQDPDISHMTISPAQITTKRMINYSDVHKRVGGNYWIWWKTYNLLFLILSLYHGLAGVWDVLLDYEMRPLVRFTAYGLLNMVGLVFFIVGSLIIIPM